jgi:hypothetical protein
MSLHMVLVKRDGKCNTMLLQGLRSSLIFEPASAHLIRDGIALPQTLKAMVACSSHHTAYATLKSGANFHIDKGPKECARCKSPSPFHESEPASSCGVAFVLRWVEPMQASRV